VVCVCVDASRELGWTYAEFDSKMEYLNTIRRKRGHVQQVSHHNSLFICICYIIPPCSCACRKFCRTAASSAVLSQVLASAASSAVHDDISPVTVRSQVARVTRKARTSEQVQAA
jgi:hypothetical protein